MLPLEFLAVWQKARNAYARYCQPICRQYAVNQTGLDVLLFLANDPAHNTARDLCTVRGAKSGIVSVAVETLIQQGYLSRVDDPADRRIRRLHPTDRARPLIEQARAIQRTFYDAMTANISPAELQTYRAISEKLIANMENLDKGGPRTC